MNGATTPPVRPGDAPAAALARIAGAVILFAAFAVLAFLSTVPA